ncbi:uncharacterized protein METZ01_LOCUS322631, partial [marine metagenome]
MWPPLFDQIRQLYADVYPSIEENADHILQTLTREE